jgi:beta-mannosidase
MNMLRVWGGGIYEHDVFYELCDKYGILLWHDFMFACSMYPGNDEFLSNVKEEFIENIVRLRNHPSIALWCGNNEIDAAWCNESDDCGWRWKQQFTTAQRAEVWKAYDTIFHSILPEIIKAKDEMRFYWPSSPVADWGKTASYSTTSGDMHYWGVWHGSEPFEKFEEVKSRFMSEYGFQAFPEINTIKEFTLPQDWDIYSDVMLAHQRSPIGNQKIKEYLEMYYPLPDDFAKFLYVGQVLQAFGIKHAIDYHRINKPYCMGTLFWQLNDCWPGASWSSIDYYTNWKALQYKARDAYEPLRLAAIQKDKSIYIYVLNDIPEANSGALELSVIDFNGKILYSQKVDIKFSFDSSTKVYSIDLSKITPVIPLESSLLKAVLYVKDKEIDTELHYFVKPKFLKLPPSTLKYNLEKKANSYILRIEATNLEKDVAFYIPGLSVNFSDNYFDLLPGESKEVTIDLKTSANDVLKRGISIHTLNSVYAKK